MINTHKNKLIQVKVSLLAYEFLKKYSDMFGVSLSRFCEMAINEKIIKIGDLGYEQKKV